MRRILLSIALYLIPFSLFAFTASDIKLFTLENGLKVYFLEDSSSPSVRLELSVNAGFTNQGPENTGLFTVYAKTCGGEISNDSVRFISLSAPAATEKEMIFLASKLKAHNLTDKELSAIIKTMNDSQKEYSESSAGFINTAIDSKLFPANPWSRESGIPPSFFSAERKEEIRARLELIADNYYTASNSSLFVSGNITEKALLAMVKKHFALFPARQLPSVKNPWTDKAESSLSSIRKDRGRKFVLFHKDFSEEMSQIVLQYLSLDSDEGDALAASWNRDGSLFKKLLLEQKNLKILGDEYIDVSSAQEKNASRLIIQSLLGSAKLSPAGQAELFLNMSRAPDVFSSEELKASLKKEVTAFTRLSESSDRTMEMLSRSLSSSKNPSEEVLSFFEKNERLSKININDVQEKVLAEEPFVFLLLNPRVYQQYASSLKNAGFEVIPQRESAWYNQAFYKNFLKSDERKSQPSSNLLEEIAASASRFISKNLSEFSSFTLENGIPVTVKRSNSSASAVLSITIAGGELLFYDKVPGLSSVLTDSIAVNIRRSLDSMAANEEIKGFYEVSSRTLSTHSIISITCLAGEIDSAVQAAYTALVYSDIKPATADGVAYDERKRWRLKCGSGDFQLLCEAVRLLYADSEYPKLYRETEDKPSQTLDFTKILESYPVLLDSTRFSLILSGSLPDEDSLEKTLNSSFALLGSIQETQSTDLRVPAPDFTKLASDEKRIKLRHLFLTDISKEEAGPMPAILVPTTKFLDPVLYCLPAPDLSSTDLALFDALLIETATRMEERLSKKYSGTKVRAVLPDNDLPFARLVVTNVEHTDEAGRAYSECIDSLKKDLSREIELKTEGVIDLEKKDLLSGLENNWLLSVLGTASSQSGTARLMQWGEIHKNPKLYLKQYEAVSKAEAEDYYLIALSYLSEKAPLTVYSVDSDR